MTRRYDFYLIVATVALLLALGALCVYGTAYSFLASQADRQWTQTPAYEDYLFRMNSLAYPLVAGIILVMGLCIPKRIIPTRHLLPAAGALLALAAAVAALAGIAAGLTALMAVSLAVQAAVAVLTAVRHERLVFERPGHAVQLGSALLHLGFVVFAFDLAVLDESSLHLAVFWVACAMMTAGVVLAFYSEELFRARQALRRRRA